MSSSRRDGGVLGMERKKREGMEGKSTKRGGKKVAGVGGA